MKRWQTIFLVPNTRSKSSLSLQIVPSEDNASNHQLKKRNDFKGYYLYPKLSWLSNAPFLNQWEYRMTKTLWNNLICSKAKQDNCYRYDLIFQGMHGSYLYASEDLDYIERLACKCSFCDFLAQNYLGKWK